jgi:hypothetical protein
LVLDEQDDYRDQTKHPAIARLGRFGTQLPGATDSDLSLDAAAAQLHCVQADQERSPSHGAVVRIAP